MAEASLKTSNHTAKPVGATRGALPEFAYENGYVFRGTDLGGHGVKIELLHQNQDGGAIILPPAKAAECANWLLQTIGQPKPSLPDELPVILERIIKQKELRRGLKRGEKKKLEDALKVLQSAKRRN